MVHLRVFRDRTYSAGVFLMTVLGFVLYGSMVLLPILLQTLLGYPALEAGIAMAPRGWARSSMMPRGRRACWASSTRARCWPSGWSAPPGRSVCSVELNLNAGYWDIFWPQFVQGASLALLFVPLTTATMDPIPKEEMGNATSMFNLMRNMGGSVGIASGTTFLFRMQQFHTVLLGAQCQRLNPRAQADAARHPSQNDRARLGSGDGHAPIVRGRVGDGAAAGGHAGLYRYLPRDGPGVPGSAAALARDEKAQASGQGRRGDALRLL